MPMFELQGPDGGTYQIDAPDAAAAVAALRKVAAPKEADPVRATVRKEMADLKAMGAPVGDGYSRQFLQGATFGAADEILAGLYTPFEMYNRGTLDPRKGYEYAKAREDILLEDARKKGGVSGMATEAVGGVLTGGTLARGGLTLMSPQAGALSNAGRAAIEGVGYGALSGFNEGSGLQDRLDKAQTGAAIGGAVGGGVGLAAPLISAASRNTLGWLSATRDPDGYAGRQLARAVSESGRTPQQIAQDLADASAAGQPLTIADAIGNPGQRMLSTVARNPGAGRTEVVNFLDSRQAGQGRRLANALAEGLDASDTAQFKEAAMRAARKAEANMNYGAARADARPVDPSAAIAKADELLQPGAMRVMGNGTDIAEDSVAGAVRRARSYLTDGRSVVSDFDQAFAAKIELDNLIENARPTVQSRLIPIKNALDDALANASDTYALARDTFRAQSKAIDAVTEGRSAARSGRSEDTIRRFSGLSPDEQAGWRTGYADNLIEGVQSGAMGANKARPFTSDAFADELAAFAAPGQAERLAKRLARENLMFETRAMATGGSRTADNLADNAAAGVDPEIVRNLLSGNFGAAARNVVVRSSDTLSGNTAPVREQLAKLLLETGSRRGQAQIEKALSDVVANRETRQRLAKALLSGLFGGTASGSSAVRQKN